MGSALHTVQLYYRQPLYETQLTRRSYLSKNYGRRHSQPGGISNLSPGYKTETLLLHVRKLFQNVFSLTALGMVTWSSFNKFLKVILSPWHIL